MRRDKKSRGEMYGYISPLSAPCLMCRDFPCHDRWGHGGRPPEVRTRVGRCPCADGRLWRFREYYGSTIGIEVMPGPGVPAGWSSAGRDSMRHCDARSPGTSCNSSRSTMRERPVCGSQAAIDDSEGELEGDTNLSSAMHTAGVHLCVPPPEQRLGEEAPEKNDLEVEVGEIAVCRPTAGSARWGTTGRGWSSTPAQSFDRDVTEEGSAWVFRYAPTVRHRAGVEPQPITFQRHHSVRLLCGVKI